MRIGLFPICFTVALAYLAPLAAAAFPPGLSKYQARLFELIDPDEAPYDAVFAAQLDALLAPHRKGEKRLVERLTSGPTTRGRQVALRGAAYIYYGVCQAHQCDTTTLELLYDPARRRMVGKLLDRCNAQWLGQPDREEMAALEEQHRLGYPATAKTCHGR